MTEQEEIAARLASASWFPIPTGIVGQRDSVAHVEVDGDVVDITVTDHNGSRREYYARVELVCTVPADITGQCRHCTVPVDSGDTCTFCRIYVPPEPAERAGGDS
ncbi:hypothetical protein A5784_32790 [Mycobacterium sp. 852013-50091_SCH5140682]|uniref:hypothetical protein n=1 Tax=Mycobacterium sp. 852013-50091_SCH5140682 TaxID=1834109 RepID=UPI0007E9BE95|nr:hypothetical protein [Mycobacterium sp. 852013-50091_SCH5140682]OBC12608.1 hypothetical protein A5784_32790 [Mycobacterium sp. 852013-50091_SCH5140682]